MTARSALQELREKLVAANEPGQHGLLSFHNGWNTALEWAVCDIDALLGRVGEEKPAQDDPGAK